MMILYITSDLYTLTLDLCFVHTPHRYSETQLGKDTTTGASRYRDWVCLMYNAETMSVEKAKLDSHVFPAIAEAYESPYLQPWGANTSLFVRASSPRLLSMMGSPVRPMMMSHDDTFAAFSRSVRTHLHHNTTTTAPTTVYSDVVSSQVLAVYQQQGSPTLDFVQFCLVPKESDC